MDGTPYNKSQKRQKERNKNVGWESKIKINKKKNKKKWERRQVEPEKSFLASAPARLSLRDELFFSRCWFVGFQNEKKTPSLICWQRLIIMIIFTCMLSVSSCPFNTHLVNLWSSSRGTGYMQFRHQFQKGEIITSPLHAGQGYIIISKRNSMMKSTNCEAGPWIG